MATPPLRHSVRIRFLLSLAVGAGAGITVATQLGLAAGVLLGWAFLAIVNVAWILLFVWKMDAARTREYAIAEDPGRTAARLTALIGSVTSLAAVLLVVIQAKHATGVRAYELAGIAVLSVAASWFLIQVDYMLRYARVYYAEPVGGISFNQDEDPRYTDFAYFSVGLGMTYQVADTNVRSNEVRRIVIAQTLLAYLFGAVILATVINLVTGLN
jgi:uncharacterized membrane protein